jgi:hypothetical protein
MEIFTKLGNWIDSTHLVEQIKEIDYIGLSSNPWFIVPFGLLIGYMVFKQKWKDIVIITLLVAIWWVSGTEYMSTLTVNGELQINKVLPVMFGGAGALGLVIYLLFGRSD